MKKKFLSIMLTAALVFSGQAVAFAESEAPAESQVESQAEAPAESQAEAPAESQAEAPAEAENKEDESIGGFLSSLFKEDSPLGGLIKEGGFVDELLKDDSIKQLLPEGVNASEILGNVREQLTNPNSDLYQQADSLYKYVTNEDGSLNEDAIMNLASGLFNGKEEAAGEQVDMSTLMKAIQDYIKSMNAESMEQGDVQSVIFLASNPIQQEDGSYKILGMFPQNNYALDGKDLYVLDSVTRTLLITVKEDEDGSWKILDVEEVSEGDNYEEGLAALCEEIDYTTEDFYELIALPAIYEYSALMSVLQEVADAERIEYYSEMLTEEQVKEGFDELLKELMAQHGQSSSEAAPAESAAESVAESTAESVAESAAESVAESAAESTAESTAA